PGGPDAERRVVGERRAADREGVPVPGQGGILGPRDRHALVEGPGRVVAGAVAEGEVAHQPPVGEAIVEDDGITLAVALAPAAEPPPQRGDVPGAEQPRPRLAVFG